jgi:hypothetical protein
VQPLFFSFFFFFSSEIADALLWCDRNAIPPRDSFKLQTHTPHLLWDPSPFLPPPCSYVYGSGRSDTVKDILIRVVGSGNGAALSGSGSDSQGDYDWSGTLAGGEFTLVKQYLGAHAIAHSGTYDRATGTVKGTWSIKGTRASGGFQMSEQVGRRVNGVSMGDAAKSGGEVRVFTFFFFSPYSRVLPFLSFIMISHTCNSTYN